MFHVSYRSGMIAQTSTHLKIKTEKNKNKKKKIDDWMDTRTIDSLLAEYVLCMQHHRWFNMFPNELLLLSLSPPIDFKFGYFFSPCCLILNSPLLTCFCFVFQKREENRIFNYSNPFFPFRSTRYRLLKSSQRWKNTQNAGKFVSFYLFIYFYIKGERERTRESETCIINLCGALRALLHS